ncbi:MAG TPA: hypothetical protein VLA76_10030 [Candidatus Angelobacter sp.]|nr:hypothetical protein [Candidatus Angelobacter sp.]
MERNLPATQDDAAAGASPEEPMEPAPRPVNVAFLPLALSAFVLVAFVMAAWTFLHAAF